MKPRTVTLYDFFAFIAALLFLGVGGLCMYKPIADHIYFGQFLGFGLILLGLIALFSERPEHSKNTIDEYIPNPGDRIRHYSKSTYIVRKLIFVDSEFKEGDVVTYRGEQIGEATDDLKPNELSVAYESEEHPVPSAYVRSLAGFRRMVPTQPRFVKIDDKIQKSS